MLERTCYESKEDLKQGLNVESSKSFREKTFDRLNDDRNKQTRLASFPFGSNQSDSAKQIASANTKMFLFTARAEEKINEQIKQQIVNKKKRVSI